MQEAKLPLSDEEAYERLEAETKPLTDYFVCASGRSKLLFGTGNRMYVETKTDNKIS